MDYAFRILHIFSKVNPIHSFFLHGFFDMIVSILLKEKAHGFSYFEKPCAFMIVRLKTRIYSNRKPQSNVNN